MNERNHNEQKTEKFVTKAEHLAKVLALVKWLQAKSDGGELDERVLGTEFERKHRAAVSATADSEGDEAGRFQPEATASQSDTADEESSVRSIRELHMQENVIHISARAKSEILVPCLHSWL